MQLPLWLCKLWENIKVCPHSLHSVLISTGAAPQDGKEKLIGKGNHPRTNLFVSHSCFFFPSPILLHKIHSSERHYLPESFLGEWAGEAVLPLQHTDSQILQKPLSSCLALAAAVWCGLTSFIFCVLPLQCKIRGKQFSSTYTSPFWGKLILLPLTRRDACRIMKGGGRGDVDFFFSVCGNQTWPDQSLLFFLSSSPPAFFIFSIFT